MHFSLYLWPLLATTVLGLPEPYNPPPPLPPARHPKTSTHRVIVGPVRTSTKRTSTKHTSTKHTSTKHTSTKHTSTKHTTSTKRPSSTIHSTIGSPLRPSTSFTTRVTTSSSASSTSISSTSRTSSTSSSASAASSPGVAAAKLYSGAAYQAAVISHHNSARANHNASPLTWNSASAAHALIVANRCTFEHYLQDGWNEGQNIFATSGPYPNVTSGITESWYKGEFAAMAPNYGKADPPNFEDVGHLTQMVWKDTTSVGCASVDCTGRMLVGGKSSTIDKFTVCNYSPPGNYVGEFGTEVGRPNSNTNLGHWYD